MKSRVFSDEILPPALVGLEPAEVPPGVDRRSFMMRSAVIGSASVIKGRTVSAVEQARAATAPPPTVNVSPELNVVKKSRARS